MFEIKPNGNTVQRSADVSIQAHFRQNLANFTKQSFKIHEKIHSSVRRRLPTAAGEDVGLGGVDRDAADVVRVRLKHVNLFQGVVVEDSDQHVILRKEQNP